MKDFQLYMWQKLRHSAKLLLEHMGLPKNKPLLDSGAKVDQQDQPLVASAGEHTECGAKDDKGEAANEGHAKVEKVSLEHGRQREPIHPTESIKNQKSALAPTNKLTTTSVKGTLTLSNLLKELWPLASDWKTIGTMLNVPHETLNIIQHDYLNKALDCLREMLREWLEGDSSPSWEKVVEAVKLENAKIAEDIRTKYGHIE